MTDTNKGHAASLLIEGGQYDFVLGAGDDLTDEDLFSAVPAGGYAVRVGAGRSGAAYTVKSWKAFRRLLEGLSNASGHQINESERKIE